jgi:hypothetical protein
LLPEGSAVDLSTVATDGSSWFVGGVEAADDGARTVLTAAVWRSSDGTTWRRGQSIQIGRCNEGCPWIDRLVAGPAGVVLTWAHAALDGRDTAYWSDGGNAWTPVDKSTFGSQTSGLGSTSGTVLSGRFVLVGTSCSGCGTVWSSADGRAWRLEAALDLPESDYGVDVDVATDGRRLVVVAGCGLGCPTTVWSSDDGRTGWTKAATTLDVGRPQVAFAGGRFVVIGRSANGVRLFTSTEGTTWSQITDEDLPFRGCGARSLAGSPDRLILSGETDCGSIWLSK